MESQTYSVAAFCAAHGLSRAMLYLLLKDGKAPAVMKIGRRTLVSVEAAATWRKRMESETLKRAA
jgi:predicted DNA-binding transcriptional regulator AlpA